MQNETQSERWICYSIFYAKGVLANAILSVCLSVCPLHG